LNFQTYKFLVSIRFERTNGHHRTKFHQSPSNGSKYITFNGFQNGGRPPSWVLKINFLGAASIVWMANVHQRAKLQLPQYRPNNFGEITEEQDKYNN